MNAQISAELLKVRTTRALYVAAGAVIAFAALIPVLACTDPVKFGVAPLTAASLADIMRAPAQVTAGAALLVGILASTAEYSHRSILTTRLVQPHPARVLGAKAIAMAAVGAALGAAAEGVAAGIGAIGLTANGVELEPRRPRDPRRHRHRHPARHRLRGPRHRHRDAAAQHRRSGRHHPHLGLRRREPPPRGHRQPQPRRLDAGQRRPTDPHRPGNRPDARQRPPVSCSPPRRP